VLWKLGPFAAPQARWRNTLQELSSRNPKACPCGRSLGPQAQSSPRSLRRCLCPTQYTRGRFQQQVQHSGAHPIPTRRSQLTFLAAGAGAGARTRTRLLCRPTPGAMADRRPLIQPATPHDVSESAASTPALSDDPFSAESLGFTHISPPTSPLASRPGFTRLHSEAADGPRNNPPSTIAEEGEEDHVSDRFRRQDDSGLGIGVSISTPQTARRVSIQSIPPRVVEAGAKSQTVKSPDSLSPPGSSNPFADTFPRDSSAENTPDLARERFSPRDNVGTFEDFRRGILRNARRSSTSVNDYQQYIHESDTQRLHGAPSIRSAYANDFHPTHECPTTRDFYQSRFTWLNMSIIIICIFSCVFSGIFLGLAIREPFWGKRITSNGPLTPASAILLTTVFAKLIEISFVTSFVAFLGQVLSRRAFMKHHGRGVTLSELSMWRWIVQPGTLITHPHSARYAGLSFLGIMSLVSAILATLYSSASTALGMINHHEPLSRLTDEQSNPH
jgi:hypothetical protein